jgi:hypothetical protein
MVEQTQLGLLGNLNNTLANLSLPSRLGLLSTGVSLLEGQPLGQAVKTGLGTFGGLQQIDQQQRQREGIEALKKRYANNPQIISLLDTNPSGVISALTTQAFAPKTPVDTFEIVPQDELPNELKGQLVQKNTRTGKLTAIGKPTTNIGVNVGAGSKKFDEKIATELASDLKKLPSLLVDIEDLKLQRNRLDTIDASGVKQGIISGLFGDTAYTLAFPEGRDIRDRIETVVQKSLKEILGAQFAEKEGERILARAFNPALDESINQERLDILIAKLDAGVKQKTALLQQIQNGTASKIDLEKLKTDLQNDFKELFPTDANNTSQQNNSNVEPNTDTSSIGVEEMRKMLQEGTMTDDIAKSSRVTQEAFEVYLNSIK